MDKIERFKREWDAARRHRMALAAGVDDADLPPEPVVVDQGNGG